MNTRYFFILIIISVVLAACQTQEPIPEATTVVVVPTNTSTSTSTPTEIPPTPTASSTLTPTLTRTFTRTPLPPTPTIDPPVVILDYLENAVVTQIDYMESSARWDLWAGKVSNGVLEVIGKDWNGLSKKGSIMEGEGIIIDFKFDKDAQFEMFLDRGDWYTDAYRRFGIYIYRNYPKANLWLGKQGLGFNNLYGNFQPTVDHWYTLLMVVDTNGEFLALIWDPEDQSKIFSYNENLGEKWAGYKWIFKIGANAGTATFDNCMEIAFDEIKH